MYIVAGDMNARIGESLDFIKDVDEVDTRRVLDNTINNHGKELINFLLETKCGIVNGRINPSCDNFTSVSRKGKAVVDYIIVPLLCFSLCDYFKVHLATEIMSKLGIENDKIPNHSMLEFRFHLNEWNSSHNGVYNNEHTLSNYCQKTVNHVRIKIRQKIMFIYPMNCLYTAGNLNGAKCYADKNGREK